MIKLNHAVPFRVTDQVAENNAAVRNPAAFPDDFRETAAKKDVVAKDQADGIPADELLADDKGLGQAFWPRLRRIGDIQPQVRAVAEEFGKAREIRGGGDNEDVPDPGQHEHRQGIIDHGLVVDRDQLLADDPGQGVEPGAGTAGQDDAFHKNSSCARVN